MDSGCSFKGSRAKSHSDSPDALKNSSASDITCTRVCTTFSIKKLKFAHNRYSSVKDLQPWKAQASDITDTITVILGRSTSCKSFQQDGEREIVDYHVPFQGTSFLDDRPSKSMTVINAAHERKWKAQRVVAATRSTAVILWMIKVHHISTALPQGCSSRNSIVHRNNDHCNQQTCRLNSQEDLGSIVYNLCNINN